MRWKWILTPPELNVFKRKNSSNAPSKLYLVVLLLSFTSGLAQDTVVITSDPTGVTIEVNGRDLGTTPFVWKVGSHALDPTKRSVLSRLLKEPQVLGLSKEGFVSRKIVITSPQMVTGGRDPRPYYIVTSTSFHFKLDEIKEFAASDPDKIDPEVPTLEERAPTADVPSAQRAMDAIIRDDADTEDQSEVSSLMRAA